MKRVLCLKRKTRRGCDFVCDKKRVSFEVKALMTLSESYNLGDKKNACCVFSGESLSYLDLHK